MSLHLLTFTKVKLSQKIPLFLKSTKGYFHFPIQYLYDPPTSTSPVFSVSLNHILFLQLSKFRNSELSVNSLPFFSPFLNHPHLIRKKALGLILWGAAYNHLLPMDCSNLVPITAHLDHCTWSPCLQKLPCTIYLLHRFYYLSKMTK